MRFNFEPFLTLKALFLSCCCTLDSSRWDLQRKTNGKKSECTDIANRMCEWFYAQLSKNADILQLISLLLRINVKMI